ncbi:class F sortase [Agromyces mangrovi Wang et al. 2018]|uniref:class F sortase n=1 Tax=Agromyces mangrovi TaxID=1858653 RepID=UPI002572A29A|nr:class F sortase [Agromyces mangrovi]BDZ66016.1 class F sortase [Agromyces mangrovi]
MNRTRAASVAAACCAGAALAALLAAGTLAAGSVGAAGSTDVAGQAPIPVIDASVPVPSAASVEPAEAGTASVPSVPVRSSALDDQPADPTEAPVRLHAPGIGVDVEVVRVGIVDGDVMELPENPNVAGWYRYGPGIGDESGTVVVAAHVDSLEFGLGPFAAIADAPVGTEIVLTSAEGTTERFVIASRDAARKGSVDWDAVFDRSGERRLAIITCGGEFDWERRTYLDSVVVLTEPVG